MSKYRDTCFKLWSPFLYPRTCISTGRVDSIQVLHLFPSIFSYGQLLSCTIHKRPPFRGKLRFTKSYLLGFWALDQIQNPIWNKIQEGPFYLWKILTNTLTSIHILLLIVLTIKDFFSPIFRFLANLKFLNYCWQFLLDIHTVRFDFYKWKDFVAFCGETDKG